MNKAFEPTIASVTAFISTSLGVDLLRTIIITIVGALVGWGTRELCNYVKKCIKNRMSD